MSDASKEETPRNLKREHEEFEKKKEEFLRHHASKYVLIVGDRVLGFFDEELEAYDEGVRACGNVPMLIKKVTEKERECASIPAMTLGLLHAR